MKLNKQWIIAHRGASGLVEHENTIESFEKAYEVGADSVELDVRKTKDGKIIVVHNPDYEGKLIKDYTYLELCEATKTNGFIMPTLEEALIYCKNKIFMDIEIKEDGYEEDILALILKYLTVDEFFIRSFLKQSIRKIKKINKRVKTVLLLGVEFPKFGFLTRIAEIFPLAKVISSKCDMVSPHYLLVRLGFHSRMKLIGKPVLVWTVNDENMMDKLLNKIKVEGIITNFPDKALKLRR